MVKVSSFGTLPRAMSTAASLGDSAAMTDSRKPESSMSKVESIASTAVRAAAKMDVSHSRLHFPVYFYADKLCCGFEWLLKARAADICLWWIP